MSNQIQEKKQKRYKVLKKIYEITDGNENSPIDIWKVGKELGISFEEIDRIDDYLKGEYLTKSAGGGGIISITHKGIVEIETSLSEPNKPTEHFPPLNFIHVEQMNNSQIQQGTTQSNQTINYSKNDFEEILIFIANLKEKFSELKFDPITQKEINSDIETIESQIKSSRPKFGIIKECLLTLRTILEGAAGSVIAGILLQQLIPLLK